MALYRIESIANQFKELVLVTGVHLASASSPLVAGVLQLTVSSMQDSSDG